MTGDPGGIYELLQWYQRVDRQRLLFRPDDEAGLQALSAPKYEVRSNLTQNPLSAHI